MPLFDFICRQCGNKFEDLVKRDESSTCPQCHSGNVEKLVSRCARYKGSSPDDSASTPVSSGCGGCMGGNCSSCGR